MLIFATSLGLILKLSPYLIQQLGQARVRDADDPTMCVVHFNFERKILLKDSRTVRRTLDGISAVVGEAREFEQLSSVNMLFYHEIVGGDKTRGVASKNGSTR